MSVGGPRSNHQVHKFVPKAVTTLNYSAQEAWHLLKISGQETFDRAWNHFLPKVFLILQNVCKTCKILQFEFLVLRQVKLVCFESMINHRCSFLHRPTIRSKDDNFSRRQEPVPIDIILFYVVAKEIGRNLRRRIEHTTIICQNGCSCA